MEPLARESSGGQFAAVVSTQRRFDLGNRLPANNLGSGNGTLSKLDSIQIESAAMLNPNVTFPYTLGCPTACWVGDDAYVCYKYWADTTLTTQPSIVYRRLTFPPLTLSGRATIRAADGVRVTALKAAVWTPNLSGTARVWLAFTNNNTAASNRDSLYVGFEQLSLGPATTYPARRRTEIILGTREADASTGPMTAVSVSGAGSRAVRQRYQAHDEENHDQENFTDAGPDKSRRGVWFRHSQQQRQFDRGFAQPAGVESGFTGRPSGADSFFVMVFKSHANNVVFVDSGTAGMTGLDTVRVGGLTYYYFHRAVADIDGARAVGQYGVVITAKKMAGSLSTPNRYSFQITSGDLSAKLDSIGVAAVHSGKGLDSLALLIDSLQAVLDTLQDGNNGPLVTMK